VANKRVRNALIDEHGNLVFVANDEDPLCDFCCFPEAKPVAALLCRTTEFRMEGIKPKLVSSGDWYVCRACLDFIMAHDAEGLVGRAMLRQLDRFPDLASDMSLVLRLRRDLLRIQRQALDQLVGWP
jgi:hypothetical protein